MLTPMKDPVFTTMRTVVADPINTNICMVETYPFIKNVIYWRNHFSGFYGISGPIHITAKKHLRHIRKQNGRKGTK